MKGVWGYRILILIFVFISTIACTNIYIDPPNSWCPTCEKFEDQGYQKVKIVTNYDNLSPEEFKAFVEKEAKAYKWTKIRWYWKKVLGGKIILREGYIYYVDTKSTKQT